MRSTAFCLSIGLISGAIGVMTAAQPASANAMN